MHQSNNVLRMEVKMEVIKKGPAAPKDPVEKRACMYVVLDKLVSGVTMPDGQYRDCMYLEGRIKSQVKIASGDISEEILSLLESVSGFRKLVHSIGVVFKADEKEDEDEEIIFQLQCYGKTNKYETGTMMEMVCPCNGMEMVLPISAYPENEEDTILGSFNFMFPKPNHNFTLTVKFYVNDGYEIPEIEVDPPVQFDTPDYVEMISHSLVSTGNNYRLKHVIERAKAGEDVTIAYIGGSITQGAGGKPINTKCYAYLSYQSFCQMFSPNGGKNIHYVKAGVGGTSSEFGVVRYDRDVCNNGEIQPDLVIVEYAVNDEGDETKGICYESLVRKILQTENAPAVILNFAVFMNDWNLQDRLQPVGEHYELPMVSVKDAVVPQFDTNKVITKRQFFYDIYHPTNYGHRIMGDCLTNLFAAVDEEEMAVRDSDYDKEPVYGSQFKDLICFDRSNADKFAQVTEEGFGGTDMELQCTEMNMDLSLTPQFPRNWHKEENAEAEFKMTLQCRNLLIVMKDSGDSSFGKADAWVDGKLIRTLDPLANGWNHCNSLILIDEMEFAEHEVVIRMHPGYENKKFTILGFGVSAVCSSVCRVHAPEWRLK